MSLIDFFRRKKPNLRPSNKTLLPSEPENTPETSERTMFGFSGVVISDVGSVRPNNEDNYVLGKYMNETSSDHSEISASFSDATATWRYAGVFDGMGGGEVGELASRIAAEVFLQAFNRLNGTPSKTEIDLCMRQAFLEANNRIIDLQKEYKIFGTTGTVMCSNGVEFKIFHLGDSRAYLVRENDLLQLTKDQTLAQMKMDVGMYDEDNPAAEADKHKLTEYIGRDWTKESIKPVESYWIPVQVGDMILLCSDGLYDMCTNEEITEILRSGSSINEATTNLVGKACSNGGEDNITCILVSFT